MKQYTEYEYDVMRSVKVLYFGHERYDRSTGPCEHMLAIGKQDGIKRLIYRATEQPEQSLPHRWVPDLWLHTLEQPIQRDADDARHLLDRGLFPEAEPLLREIAEA